MLDNLNIVNSTLDNLEGFDIGGEWGCYIACAGGCLITKMMGAAVAVAVMDLS